MVHFFKKKNVSTLWLRQLSEQKANFFCLAPITNQPSGFWRSEMVRNPHLSQVTNIGTYELITIRIQFKHTKQSKCAS